MKIPVPPWVWPLNVAQIHGTMCCHQMQKTYRAHAFLDGFFRYQARSIHEANVLVVWGSLSKKLALLVQKQAELMIKNHCLIHIRGCDRRIDNEYSSSSLSNVLTFNTVFSNCKLDLADYEQLVREARRCLRA